jgi:hypothetical protein
MYRMSTGHFVRCAPRIEQVLLTYRAIGSILALFAIVIGVETAINAHAAFVTMQKVVGSSHSTKAAIGTVVRSLLVRHPQIANIAMVRAKLYRTGYTVVRFAALSRKAFAANDFHHGESIDIVVIVLRDLRQGCCHGREATGQRGTAMRPAISIVDFWWSREREPEGKMDVRVQKAERGEQNSAMGQRSTQHQEVCSRETPYRFPTYNAGHSS